MSMTILKATDVVAIKNSGNTFTAAQIMEYCSNLGFTSFMLFAEANSSYYILPCNPTKSDDNIYLFEDTSISVNGFHSTASASSAYHNKFVYSPSAGTLSDSNETSVMGYTYAQTTWGRRYYYDGAGSRPNACFYTTLSYDKIYLNQTDITPAPDMFTSNGGGATHIAKVTGQLSSLSNNLSGILMVSGGGGGGLLVGDTDYSGKEAGGISGSGDNSANQSTGYAFGQGESADGVSGGGSGLYGGYKGTSSKSGGAGSGYIGNSLVSNKKMVGYNVPTSDAESTKTESVDEASESPVSGKPKIGNGHARIKFLRSCWGGEEVAILWAGNSNKMTVQISNGDILFKLYTGDTAIYSFTAYAGSTVLDADNIYVHFLIESEQQLAKPSMVYANGSVLSYNQEEPTDAEMADIYTWLSAGLPST